MGHSGNMKEKQARIHVRVPADLKNRIVRVVEKTKIDEAILVRNCVDALCDYWEATGSVTFPLTFVVPAKKSGDKADDAQTSVAPNESTKDDSTTPDCRANPETLKRLKKASPEKKPKL